MSALCIACLLTIQNGHRKLSHLCQPCKDFHSSATNRICTMDRTTQRLYFIFVAKLSILLYYYQKNHSPDYIWGLQYFTIRQAKVSLTRLYKQSFVFGKLPVTESCTFKIRQNKVLSSDMVSFPNAFIKLSSSSYSVR